MVTRIKDWKPELNARKCTTTLFSNDIIDNNWQASINLGNITLQNDDNPVCLGVKYENQSLLKAEEEIKSSISYVALTGTSFYRTSGAPS